MRHRMAKMTAADAATAIATTKAIMMMTVLSSRAMLSSVLC
jgi:hypothetical protein